MTNDTIRTVATYLIAIIVLIGTGLLLRFPPPGIPPEALLAFLGVQVGLVMGYVFGERTASSAAANAAPNTTTITAAPPSTVHVDTGGSGGAVTGPTGGGGVG